MIRPNIPKPHLYKNTIKRLFSWFLLYSQKLSIMTLFKRWSTEMTNDRQCFPLSFLWIYSQIPGKVGWTLEKKEKRKGNDKLQIISNIPFLRKLSKKKWSLSWSFVYAVFKLAFIFMERQYTQCWRTGKTGSQTDFS